MIVIVSNSRDFGVDDIVEHLRQRGASYIRIDLDLLENDEIILDPVEQRLSHTVQGGERRVVTDVRSVLYRAPTHLRESSGHRYSPEELLKRHQWAAFARSMMVFKDAVWVNHPMQTFAAENKPFQLATAAALGFSIPRTYVTNVVPAACSGDEDMAVKALDTFLVRADDADLFFYTTRVKPGEITPEESRTMPFILQDYVHSKMDIRATVVGNRCFVAMTDGRVEGDWRLQKDAIRFSPTELPDELSSRCIALVRELGLLYGAIDLSWSKAGYTFFEINPTGEWSWLDPVFDGGISRAMADLLVDG
jgi:hypothetical protein